MGYADRLGKPEIILLLLFNVAFLGGLAYLILF